MALRDPFPQATEVRPAHEPENSCKRGFEGADDKVMVVFELTATKLYHTSFLLAVPHPMEAIVDEVEPTSVPDVFEQLEFDVSVTAPAHSSFAGGVCVTQILKLAEVPEGAEPTLATLT